MYFNIKDIEKILEGMQCDFADLVWKNHMIKEYSLQVKPCSKEEIEKLESFIPIIEFKLAILKNFKATSNYYSYPQRIQKTDVDTFWNADKILNECDSKILEKFKYYGITPSVLELTRNPEECEKQSSIEDCGCN
jgi:hypothetical protein